MAAHPVEITRLTAAGSGAVAVLRLEGEDLLPLLGRHLLTPGGRPITEERLAQEADSARHRPIFVHIPLTNMAARDAADRPREEAVLYLPSRTTAELSCHGGDLLVESVISLFLADGAAAASGAVPQDEGFRSSARRLLPKAETDRAAEVLLDQLGGAARRFWTDLFDAIDTRALTLAQAAERLEKIASYESFGEHLARPYRVVLSGVVNAGKSTLLNALVGYDRALTAPEAGTTRDAVSAETAFEGIAVRLYDTAGMRPNRPSPGETGPDTVDAVEREGIRLAESLLSGADLVLILNPLDDPDDELTGRLAAAAAAGSRACAVVRTKADLVPDHRSDPLTVSGLDPKSFERLGKQIADILVPAFPESGSPVPLTPGEAALYRRAAAALRGGNPLSDADREVIMTRLDA